MPLPSSRLLTRLLTTLLLSFSLLCFSTQALAQPISEQEKKEILAKAEKLVREEAYAAGTDFGRWDDHLKKFRERLDAADTAPRFSSVVNQMLSEYGISHLDILSPAAARQIEGSTFSGIGVSLTPLRRDGSGAHQIQLVLENSPAQKAGLKVGDVILSADGKPLTDTSLLRGPTGSVVKVEVQNDDGTTRIIDITRGRVSFREPELLVDLDDDTALIRIPTFHSDYDRRNVNALMRKALNKKRLIIDLRFNGGGEVRNMLHFLGLMLPRGQVIGTSVSREQAQEFARTTGGDADDVVAVADWVQEKMRIARNDVGPYKGQVVVLINRFSASASEIVAQSLVELKGAITVGTPTAGAVLVSSYERLPNGFQMKVPHSEYVSIKGRRLEGKPLEPDHTVRGGGEGLWNSPRAAGNATPTADELRTKAKNDRAVKVALEKLNELDGHAHENKPKPNEQPADKR